MNAPQNTMLEKVNRQVNQVGKDPKFKGTAHKQ